MELSLSSSEHLERLSVLHPRLCPRQVLGVRMARLACIELGIDPSLNRKSIYVFMEIGRCTADAVIIVTGASPTNGLMQLMNYGKVAATFVNLKSGEALRVSERTASREIAASMLPRLSRWAAQCTAYQIMPDNQLLDWQPVTLKEDLPTIPPKHAVTCQQCGDRVHEYREVLVDGRTLCQACAYGAYFAPVRS